MLLLRIYILLHLPPIGGDCHMERASLDFFFFLFYNYCIYCIAEMDSLIYLGDSYNWLMQVLEGWRMQGRILWTDYAMFAGMLRIK